MHSKNSIGTTCFVELDSTKYAENVEPVSEFLVSSSGQMSVPAAIRHRWGLDGGGKVTIVDLGEVAVLLPPGARERLLDSALSAEQHRQFVAELDDPDLATT